MSDWCCGSECDFWEADSRSEGFGWCKAPLPWEVLWNAGDMLHANAGDECGWTLEEMVEARAAWEPVIAARRKAEEVQVAAKRQRRERRCVAVTSSDDRGNCACGCRDERICKSCRDGSFTFTATLYEAGSDAHKTRACGTCSHWNTDLPPFSPTSAYCSMWSAYQHASDGCSEWQEGATEVER